MKEQILQRFKEELYQSSGFEILAQKYVDNGSHPDYFKSGFIREIVITEYKRRKILELSEKITNLSKSDSIQLKSYLKMLKGKNIILESFGYKKLDKIYEYICQLKNSSENKGMENKSRENKSSENKGMKNKSEKNKGKKNKGKKNKTRKSVRK